MEVIAFYAFAAIAVLASLLVVGQGNPMHSVMLLIVSFGALAGLYVLLDAPFTAVTQIIVYAGAIMVLFLFVIMLLNLGRPGPMDVKGPVGVGTAFLLGGVLLFQLWVLRQAALPASIQLPPGSVARLQQEQGFVAAIAQPLFDTYLIPFEITSLLLLAALVGAVVLAKRRL